jgi:YfiH family protein
VPAAPPLLKGTSLARIEGLAHGATTRDGGVSRGPWASLNLGLGSGDDAAAVRENLRRAAGALGFDQVVLPRQVHGRRCVPVEGPDAVPGDADALVTDRPGVLLGVLGADCVGVLLVDARRRVLALAHAGWRGLVAGILSTTLDALRARHGSRPDDLEVLLGPAISAARYEVGDEVVRAVESAVPDGAACLVPGPAGRPHLDLKAALRRQLEAAGVSPAAVEDLARCTHGEPDAFFSHRRDGPRTGRIALLAGWRDT